MFQAFTPIELLENRDIRIDRITRTTYTTNGVHWYHGPRVTGLFMTTTLVVDWDHELSGGGEIIGVDVGVSITI